MSHEAEQSYADTTPAYFDPESVGMASFLATPLAGAILHASNHWMLGAHASAALSVVLGAFATAVLFLLGSVLPQSLAAATLPLQLIVVFTMRSIARGWVEDNGIDYAVSNQQARFRQRTPVVLIGACVATLFVVLYAAGGLRWSRVPQTPRHRVVSINSHSVVAYGSSVSETEARTLGDAFVRFGVFNNETNRSVTLERIDQTLVLSVPMIASATPEQRRGVIFLARLALAAVDATRFARLQLTNTQDVVQSSALVTPLRVVNVPDRSQLFVSSDIPDAQSLDVARFLQEQEYFSRDVAATAIIERVDEVPTLGVPVDRRNATPGVLRSAQALAHRFAARLHVLRAQVQLVDETRAVSHTFIGDPREAESRPTSAGRP